MSGRSTEHKIVKSFAEQRAGAAAGTSTGIACPRCGCTVTMVTTTRRLFGIVRRYRQCVHPKCRYRFTTQEKH